jgi:DNA-binding MarR family transcriptional regulator
VGVPHDSFAVEEDAARLLDGAEHLAEQTDLGMCGARFAQDYRKRHVLLCASGSGIRDIFRDGDEHPDTVLAREVRNGNRVAVGVFECKHGVEPIRVAQEPPANNVTWSGNLASAGYTDLRMRHSVLLESLPREDARVTTLAVQLGMTKQAMGELVDDCESRGYIERQSDPKDRRARLIVFTEKGRIAYELAFEILARMESEYAALVGAERYETARQTFAELIQSLETRGD